ncbi:efflux RND transporter periplasmic adaptor subunit [Emticicia agri]|uniref:HlyD family efflux transporter periplasmic adaptor subunit n=1 Tax=Emticicia agri TaxID=2492393 RepID=A0A4Q5LX35_9BACT|nr:HlyD family efflux transporter periplasmic adaptor subunit [Emticicia agri]RYU94292.1 HlyD family efflux transporter periplasmic adaptor subunit [Emticicia agri]
MDKEISIQEVRKQKSKNWLIGIVALVVIILIVWWLRNTLSSSITRAEIRTAVAEMGAVENTLTASGEVQPEFEQVITSPITAVIQQVVLDAGTQVKAGEKILELDKETTQLTFDKEKDEVELKKNKVVKLRLDLDKSFYDLKIDDSIKAMKITSLKADVENAKRLQKAGGGTREAIETAEMNLRIAELEKKQLENDIRIKQQTMRADIKDSELSAQIQEKQLMEYQSKLQKANIIATRPGVLTYVNKNLGSKVSEGEILARLADLGSFKIIGSISDNYANQVKIGMPVIIRINDTQLRGSLTNIQPSVQNNILSFDVALDSKSTDLLRPKLKVEVFLITAAQQNVVRVANGPAFKGGSVQEIFVLRKDGKAEKRTVKVGLANFDYVEIIDGVKPGETVIISDLSEYKNTKELEIK